MKILNMGYCLAQIRKKQPQMADASVKDDMYNKIYSVFLQFYSELSILRMPVERE